MFTDEDKSFYDKIITGVSEQQTEGNEPSPADMPSPKESGKLDSKEPEEGRPTGELGTGGGAGTCCLLGALTGAHVVPEGWTVRCFSRTWLLSDGK